MSNRSEAAKKAAATRAANKAKAAALEAKLKAADAPADPTQPDPSRPFNGLAWIEPIMNRDEDRISGKLRDAEGVQHQIRGLVTNTEAKFEVLGRDGTLIGMGTLVVREKRKDTQPLASGRVAIGDDVRNVNAWPRRSSKPGSIMIAIDLDNRTTNVAPKTTSWG